MWKDTEVTRRLGLAAPIVQGPFGGGISSVELVVAVSESGGLGSFGVHHLGAAGIRDVAGRIRARTSRPFALNLWIPLDDADDPRIDDAQFARNAALLQPYFTELGLAMPPRPERFAPRYAEQIEAVLAARPAVFSFVFGIASPEVLARCRELGIVTLGAATTVDEAIALEKAGVDMVVATGSEAGGHRVSFLRGADESLSGTFSLVPQVADAVRIPVIAAGGIADARGIAAALTLGAHAVQIGTAFLACEESNANPAHRGLLFSPDARHTGLTRVFSGRLARGIENRLMRELQPHADRLPGYPVQNWFMGALKKAAAEQERGDLMSLWCGQSAALLRHRDARSLMTALVNETSALLDKG
ncbi:NAD(P)H-dependent flavin oxidoreductase [Pseudoduganella plicata]|uniref:Nitronate monooxygenase n=1 Tax=Pseudoduganella plicata TaxID=321984 RepID=A0A4P7BHI0_9BURK|nr:nitronate monooxygenase [Pseudoduganella plicata]QBQ38234.1 nitronate monooxygenase [Pseudoduganella plicata]GGY80439.1 putative nitronate monooxygenase [Pseudoduganella plicata]